MNLKLRSAKQLIQSGGRKNLLKSGMFLLVFPLFFLPSHVVADDLQDCMIRGVNSASPDTTIGDLQMQCEKELRSYTVTEEGKETPVVTARIRQDKKHVLQPFTIMAHRPNYFLGAVNNSAGFNSEAFRESFHEPDLSWGDTEIQFQLSMKFPLLVDLFNDTVDIYAAYTQRAFWQVYHSSGSAQFRENNYEPEIWVQFSPSWELFGFKNTWNSLGLVHQSNGRGGTLERSWNRVFAWLTIEREKLALSFRPWYRIPENNDDDNNPDITDYLGHFELYASYKWNEHVFSMMSRNNLESGFEKGSVELSWSIPLGDWPYLKGYVQYFTGYGRDLVDYKQYSNTIGVGISLTDWL